MNDLPCLNASAARAKICGAVGGDVDYNFYESIDLLDFAVIDNDFGYIIYNETYGYVTLNDDEMLETDLEDIF